MHEDLNTSEILRQHAQAPGGHVSDVRAGVVFTMRVAPPPAYAGHVGQRATVVAVSTDVYVVFESGIRESFPLGRFRQFFGGSQQRTT